MTVRAALKLRR
jgi:hypothetical protein